MAVWEELVHTCDLKADMPKQAVDILKYRVSEGDESMPLSIPDHYFFNEPHEYKWEELTGSGTTYFPGEPFARLTKYTLLNFYGFTLRTMVRHGEYLIQGFLDWLAAYSETQGFVGYTRCDEIPDVVHHIHFEAGIVYYNSVMLYKNPPTVERVKISRTDS